MPRSINTLKNILSHTLRDEASGCLLYTRGLDKDGYPKISLQGKMGLGSHFVFALSYGAIPEGYEVDHICHVRRCVEPTHLRLLTHKQNVIQIKSYVEKRHQRLKRFIEAYPHVTSFPVLLTLPELQVLWACQSTGNVKQLLQTMGSAFSEEFFYERFEAGRRSKPALYAIGIHPDLIDRLSNEDERRETAAEDIMTFAA